MPVPEEPQNNSIDVPSEPIHEAEKPHKRMLSMKRVVASELFTTFKKPILIAILGIIGLLIFTPILTYAYFVRDLSSKESIMSRKNEGVVLLDRNDEPFFTFYEAQTKNTVTLDKIPDVTEEAIIAIEDKEFYEHPGFSLRGIGRAIIANVRDEALSQGGSTLSQQLVKNTLLSQDKNFLRKYQELVLALELERRFSKEDILEMYLNTVYFGEGAFGIEDAAHAYFNKSAADLTLAESSLLAGILPAPSALSPLSGSKTRALQRQALVLSEMRKQGYITVDEEQKAKAEEIVFNPQTDGLNQIAPHFALMVKDELIEEYGEQQVARAGFTVKTTIDLAHQEFAETTVQNNVTRLSRNSVSNGAAVAMDPKTGEVLVLVGSWNWADEDNGKINMAVRPRQPGSSFKPIVYAKAFEERILTPGSIIEDKEMSYPGGYKPKNYDNKFRGNVTIRRALATSLNIPAVVALDRVGITDAINMAEDLGITTLTNPSAYGLSLVLGAGEVPLIQMTQAFATFADEGTRHEPIIIKEIKDKKGNVIFTSKEESEEAVSREVAYLISSILSDNSARAEVFGNSLTISRIAAVKTGTTEDYRDSLTIGYTPNLTVGVWVGNNDNTPMDGIAGSSGAAPIWRSIMERMLTGLPVERFVQPAGVLTLKICRENGLRLRDEVATSSAYPEYFLRGTEPKDFCDSGVTPTVSISPTETPDPTEQPTQTPEPTQQPTTAPTLVPATPEPTERNNPLPTVLQ